MSNTLFPNVNNFEYILDLEYKGPSFAGMMEISALKTEIGGLEDAIKIITRVLSRNKKIDFTSSDLQIFIEAFEKASFRKRVKLIVRGIEKHQGIISLGVLLVMILQTIPLYRAEKLKDISAEVVGEIGDQIKVELLRDTEFLKSVANVVCPLSQVGDELFCAVPSSAEVSIKFEDKKEFAQLAGELEPIEEGGDGDRLEILQGRINRVDLDARVRHLGFKVGSEGISIPATLAENLRIQPDMQTMLGQWIELEGVTTYQDGARAHINIRKYKIIRQSELFSEGK